MSTGQQIKAKRGVGDQSWCDEREVSKEFYDQAHREAREEKYHVIKGARKGN